MKGAKSKYINKYNIPIAKEFFPGMSLEMLDASHWGTWKQIRLKEIALTCSVYHVSVHADRYIAVSFVESFNSMLIPHFRPNEFKNLVVDFVTRT